MAPEEALFHTSKKEAHEDEHQHSCGERMALRIDFIIRGTRSKQKVL